MNLRDPYPQIPKSNEKGFALVMALSLSFGFPVGRILDQLGRNRPESSGSKRRIWPRPTLVWV